jgi:hypothetical protein
MTFWILMIVCLNGAQGCTYSSGPSLRLDYTWSYGSRESCQREADRVTAMFADPEIYGHCMRVETPR